MDKKTTGDSLAQLLGSRENVKQVASSESGTVLMELEDVTKADLSVLSKTEGVTEVVTQDHQLVLRLDREMAEELVYELSISDDEPEEEADGAGKKFLAVIQGIFAPILTPLAGAGIL